MKGKKISFIGLGNMGSAMALNLLKHGVDLSAYNRSKEKLEPIVKAGGRTLKKPSDAFKESSIVFSMLANDQALVDVTEGPNGLLSTAKKGCIHVSLSTVAPETIKLLASKHEEKGAKLISATVFGRPDAAERQELWICLAGNEDAKQEVNPFLLMIGQKIFDFGSLPEMSNIVKVSGNFLILSVIEMLGEAFGVLKKNGVNPEQFLSMMTETLFPSVVFKNYGRLIAQKKYTPAGFKMTLGLKDLSLFLAASEKFSLDSPLAHVLKARFMSSLEKGREEMDWSAIALLSQG